MKITQEQREGIEKIILSYSADQNCACDESSPTCPEWGDTLDLCPREMAERIADYLDGNKRNE
jgi:hypothetical protein